MTAPIPDAALEAAARAMKSDLGQQFNATPLPGPGNPEDWSADGGVINLEQLARAALTAAMPHLNGWPPKVEWRHTDIVANNISAHIGELWIGGVDYGNAPERYRAWLQDGLLDADFPTEAEAKSAVEDALYEALGITTQEI